VEQIIAIILKTKAVVYLTQRITLVKIQNSKQFIKFSVAFSAVSL